MVLVQKWSIISFTQRMGVNRLETHVVGLKLNECVLELHEQYENMRSLTIEAEQYVMERKLYLLQTYPKRVHSSAHNIRMLLTKEGTLSEPLCYE